MGNALQRFRNASLGGLLLLGSACGGDPKSPAWVSADLQLPASLTEIGAFEVRLTLSAPGEANALWGPAGLTWAAPSTLWEAEVEGLRESSLEAVLEIGSASGGRWLPLGRAIKGIDLPSGTKTIILSLAPGDFETDIDSDGDTLSNLTEFLAGLDPFSGDTDGDGLPDSLDAFPADISEMIDEDGDGLGNRADNCPFAANEDQKDTDGDRSGDFCDKDDDGDGLSDDVEATRGSDPREPDSDGDGTGDAADNCLLVDNRDQQDTDQDGAGDACDPDDDGDGVADAVDNCRLVGNAEQSDADGDGRGDACVGDDDGDGVADGVDNCPGIPNATQKDTDREGQGDACDPDDDGDGLADLEETTLGSDHLITNGQDSDTDRDGRTDSDDNCPLVANPLQRDSDADGEGDLCDCDPWDPGIRIRNAVFVSKEGDNGHSGAQNDPVRTVERAVEIATVSGSDIYVTEGTYDEAVVLPAGIGLYGGFQGGDSCERDIAAIETTLRSSGAFVVKAEGGLKEDPTTIEGLIIRSLSTGTASALRVIRSNSATESSAAILRNRIFAGSSGSGTSRALVAEGVEVTLINNVIDGGDSRATVGLELVGGLRALVVHNTIHGGRAERSAYALRVRDGSPTVVNNILVTENRGSGFLDDQRGIFAEGTEPPEGMILVGNLIFGVANTEEPKLYFDQGGAIYTAIEGLNAGLDSDPSGGDVDLNVTTEATLDSIFADPPGLDYRLVLGSPAIDAGADPVLRSGLTVPIDLDGWGRPVGEGYDLGAFEF